MLIKGFTFYAIESISNAFPIVLFYLLLLHRFIWLWFNFSNYLINIVASVLFGRHNSTPIQLQSMFSIHEAYLWHRINWQIFENGSILSSIWIVICINFWSRIHFITQYFDISERNRKYAQSEKQQQQWKLHSEFQQVQNYFCYFNCNLRQWMWNEH